VAEKRRAKKRLEGAESRLREGRFHILWFIEDKDGVGILEELEGKALTGKLFGGLIDHI